ncbi:hypothetical protein JCM5353_003754, partial [Sporobolomyces roseus]
GDGSDDDDMVEVKWVPLPKAPILDEEDDLEVVEDSFRLPESRNSIKDLPWIIATIQQQWKDKQEVVKFLKEPRNLLKAIIFGSFFWDDDTSKLPPSEKGYRHFFSFNRAAALAIAVRFKVDRFYDLILHGGYKSLDGIEGLKRALLGRLVTFGVVDEYSSASSTFLGTLAPNVVSLEILTDLSAHPSNSATFLQNAPPLPTPNSTFDYIISLQGLPPTGMTPIDPRFPIGNARPGTTSNLSGDSSKWTSAQRELRVPRHLVEESVKIARMQSAERKLALQQLASLDREEEEETDDTEEIGSSSFDPRFTEETSAVGPGRRRSGRKTKSKYSMEQPTEDPD